MAATAVIYQPARTAMQQGRAKTRRWVLEWEPAEPRLADPLMGWIGSGDTRRQVQLRFESKDAAIEYAKSKGIDYVVREPKSRTPKTKSYADNFRW
ncbi:MAG: ETC complex I subunit [Alphaproteobacteria bacterium]